MKEREGIEKKRSDNTRRVPWQRRFEHYSPRAMWCTQFREFTCRKYIILERGVVFFLTINFYYAPSHASYEAMFSYSVNPLRWEWLARGFTPLCAHEGSICFVKSTPNVYYNIYWYTYIQMRFNNCESIKFRIHDLELIE